MIKKFKHKGLKKLFESGIVAEVQPKHEIRLRMILALFETANAIEDMEILRDDIMDDDIMKYLLFFQDHPTPDALLMSKFQAKKVFE